MKGKRIPEMHMIITHKGYILFIVVIIFVLLNLAHDEKGFGEATRDEKRIREELIHIASVWSGKTLAWTENKLKLGQPFIMKPPTTTDPLWWFVYTHHGIILELGTNTENPVYTLEEANHEDFYHTGYFKIKTQEDAIMADRYATYCIPTEPPSSHNAYSEFLRQYDMRNPISIKGVEEKLELNEPINVSVPAFINPFWTFFYRTPTCVIRLGGIALRENIEGEISAKTHRDEFLFIGYWTAHCDDTNAIKILQKSLKKFLKTLKQKFPGKTGE